MILLVIELLCDVYDPSLRKDIWMDSRLAHRRIWPRINPALISVFYGIIAKLFVNLTISISYFLGSQLGFLFTIESQPISTLWPPNAILMAALLLIPRREWVCAILSVFPAHMLIQLMDNIPIYMSLGWFFTNTAEALMGAMTIRYFIASNISFEKLRDTSAFLGFGVLLAPFFSSFLDVAAVKFLGWGQEGFWILWRRRFFSNAVSMLVFVPLIVTAIQHKSVLPSLNAKHRLEAVALLAFLFAICAIGFANGRSNHVFHGATLFALFPIMIWSALRFSAGFVALVTLVVALFGIWGVCNWNGPFIKANVDENLLGLYLFILFTCAPLTLLTAVIREWRCAEAAANNRKQQLDLAFNAGKLSVWIWEVEPKIIGKGFSEKMEKSGAKVLMPAFLDSIHPDDKDKAEKALLLALQSVETFELEIRLATPANDGYRWFSSRGSWQFREDGRPCCMLGVNADIERQRQENAQIQHLRDELAHLSRVAMLGEMSGAIAHELNQPLTAILSNAQAAVRIHKKTCQEETLVTEILGDIISEGKRAAEIIQRMRELLKKGEAQLQSSDVNAIIQKALALEHSDLISKNVAVETYIQRDLPMVMADSVQVLQVLLNLIHNACDAMRENSDKKRLIRISTCCNNDEFILISVSDRGSGIAEDQQEAIFEPFFTSKKHGLGLGLPICRSIIEAHGGKLKANNNREGGATFTLTLPIARK